MSATEKVLIAEGIVSGLQDQLGTVETVLEIAEGVAVSEENAGRCARRLFRLLLILSLVGVVALVVKKVAANRCTTSQEQATESEHTPADPSNNDGEAATDEDPAAS
ncbi:MAG: hypothetical protein U9N78_08775 [Actinomycetota bacterium]|nr:hypothetical protein [Actinomycetota bacterium]